MEPQDISFQAEKIIEKLNEYETLIMTQMGRLDISVNKNISEKTIKKKLPDDHLRVFSKSMSNLKAKGLIVKYRNENWAVPKLGRIVARKLIEKSNEAKYEKLNLRLLTFFNLN